MMTDDEIINFLSRQIANHHGDSDLNIVLDIDLLNQKNDPAFENFKHKSLIAERIKAKKRAENLNAQLQQLRKYSSTASETTTSTSADVTEDSDPEDTTTTMTNAIDAQLANEICYKAGHFIGNFILKSTRKNKKSVVKPKLIAFKDQNNSGFKLIINKEEIAQLKTVLSNFNPRLNKFAKNFSMLSLYLNGVFSFIVNKLSRLISSAVFPKEALLNDYTPESYLIPDIITHTVLASEMPDGTSIDAIVIKPDSALNNSEYILRCNSQGLTYTAFAQYYKKMANKHNVNTVLFNYPGSGLSLGDVDSQKDLYNAGFGVAKNLVDNGATYLLIDGASLGGYVAPKVASKLIKYCKKHNKNVQIELRSVNGFNSVHDFAVGFIREFSLKNLFSGEFTRSEPTLFDKFIGGILSPLISLVAYLTSWDMNAQEEIKKLPKENVDIISSEGDMIIGTYASIEYQLREDNQEDIEKLNAEKNTLEKNKPYDKHYVKKMEILAGELDLKSTRLIKRNVSDLSCTHHNFKQDADRFEKFFKSRASRKVIPRKRHAELNNSNLSTHKFN